MKQIAPDIIKLINKIPKRFIVLQVLTGQYGSIIYRSIAGSDNVIAWKEKDYTGEYLQPLEWPHKTEGYNIYDVSDITYKIFKENHLVTAHISVPLLENSWARNIITDLQKNKISLVKTHNIDVHETLNCKIIRIVGDPSSACLYKSPFYRITESCLHKINKENICNIDISKFLSNDFNIFLDEYLKMTSFLDINVNINNVRQYILLHKEKMKRFDG